MCTVPNKINLINSFYLLDMGHSNAINAETGKMW